MNIIYISKSIIIILFLSKMNKSIIALCMFLLFTSCGKVKVKSQTNQDETSSIQIQKKIKFNQNKFKSFLKGIPRVALPFRSENLTDFYVFKYSHETDEVNSVISLLHKKLKSFDDSDEYISENKRIAFNRSDKQNHLKGDYFYPIGKIQKDSIYLVIYLYEDYEDIMPSIITQINSYNISGKILDTLILDKKFHFELIYSNNFNIEKNKIIINEEIINYYDENDDLITINKEPEIKRNTKIYSIDNNGGFILK